MSEYRVGGFQILPPVIKNLLIANVLVFATTYVLRNVGIIDLDYYLALFYWKSPFFKIWQPITHMFMHANLSHLFFNMLGLWMAGNIIENVLGSKRFLVFYFICGIGAALCHLSVLSIELAPVFDQLAQLSADQKHYFLYDPRFPVNVPTVGASGAVYGVLFAFGYLFPNMIVYFNFFIPMKAKYFVAILIVVSLVSGLGNKGGDNVAHFAHLGGALFGFLTLKTWGISSKNIRRY